MDTHHARTGDTVDAFAIEQLIAALVRPELEEASGELDPDRTFADLGLDSTGVIAVAAGLEDRLGITVDSDLFFDHPTINRLAEHLAAELRAVP